MAANEATYAIEAAKKYWSICPIAFDLEHDTVNYTRKKGVEITKSLASKMAISFLKVVIKEGYIPVLYTNNDYTKNYFDIPSIEAALGTKVFIWYARYTNILTTTEKALADIWQKSSKGSIEGIASDLETKNVNIVKMQLHDKDNNIIQYNGTDYVPQRVINGGESVDCEITIYDIENENNYNYPFLNIQFDLQIVDVKGNQYDRTFHLVSTSQESPADNIIIWNDIMTIFTDIKNEQ